jgi:hypothetical protein
LRIIHLCIRVVRRLYTLFHVHIFRRGSRHHVFGCLQGLRGCSLEFPWSATSGTELSAYTLRVRLALARRMRTVLGCVDRLEKIFFRACTMPRTDVDDYSGRRWLTPRADAAEAKRVCACVQFLRWLRYTDCWAFVCRVI